MALSKIYAITAKEKQFGGPWQCYIAACENKRLLTSPRISLSAIAPERNGGEADFYGLVYERQIKGIRYQLLG